MIAHFVKPAPKKPEQKLEEGIHVAFGQGMAAARKDQPRSANPYMPSTQDALWQAWNCGYDEESPLYVVSDLVTSPLARELESPQA